MKTIILNSLLLVLLTFQVNLYSQWSNDPYVNTTLSDMFNLQRYDASVKNGSGDFITSWIYGQEYYDQIVYTQKLNKNGKIIWGPKIVQKVQLYGNASQNNIRIVNDGSGGVIVVWIEYQYINGKNLGNNIFAQRIDSLGNPKWSSAVLISSYPSWKQFTFGYSNVLPDGLGGAVIVWSDGRNGRDNRDIYAQRINSLGQTLWQTDGIPISNAPGEQLYPDFVIDETGNVFIVWTDWRNYTPTNINIAIYAQKISLTGQIQWTTDGIPICNTPGESSSPKIISDGSQGAIIVWVDRGMSAQKINRNGSIQWKENGIPIMKSTGYADEIALISDGSGGAFVALVDRRNAKDSDKPGFPNSDIFAQKLNSLGKVEWTENGIPVCIAKGRQDNCILTKDGAGGIIVCWKDYRLLSRPSDIYAQQINSLGNVQWTLGGTRLGVESYIYIQSPKNGVNMVIGTKQKITWWSRKSTGYVNIELSTNSGTTWKMIKEKEPDDGELSEWVIPEYPSKNCKIKISDYYWRGATAMSDELFTIYRPENQIVYPIGGETFYIGNPQTISWQFSSASPFVHIDLTTDGGLSWLPIKRFENNDGQLDNWIVSDYPSSQCKFRISDASNGISIISYDYFSIVPHSIQIIYPQRGAELFVQSNPTIEWNSTRLNKFINIDLSIDAGSNWISIRKKIPDDGKFRDWKVPDYPSTQCKIRITDSTGNILAESEDLFSIVRPSIEIDNNLGQFDFIIGKQYQIRWYSSALSGYVNIDLSIDGGTNWLPIRQNIIDDGEIKDWIIPNFPSTQCKIRISDISGYPSAISSGFFTIAKATISVIAPEENSKFEIGTNCSINWYNTKSSGFVDIYLSTNGGSNWIQIRNNAKDDGDIRDWIVPNYPSTQCKIRVSDTSGIPSGVSTGFFSIVKPSSIQILFPAGGEVFKSGSKPVLMWKPVKLSGYVKIDLSTDRGASWEVLRTHTVDDGKIRDWSVPNISSSQCKIRISDTSGSPSSESNIFTISKSLSKSVNKIISFKTPTEFFLEQNYPNPFNPETIINYQVPDLGSNVNVQLKVYDILGREIITLINEEQSPGYYQAAFNGSSLTSGVYIYKLTAGNFISIKKMILAK